MRYWLKILTDEALSSISSALIMVGKSYLWLAYRIEAPAIRHNVERIIQKDHLKQVIQDDLDGEPWEVDNWRFWRMKHDDEKDDR